MTATVIFWTCLACVGWTYLGYPALMAILARLRPRPLLCTDPPLRSVSIVLAARDEAPRIGPRVRELLAALASCGRAGELIVVCDGCTDSTAALAKAAGGPLTRVIELHINCGKAVALNAGWSAASGEVVVFADVRQRWDPRALNRLLDPFADPAVGAVSGELCLSPPATPSPGPPGPRGLGGLGGGVGLYWRFEKWLRCQESAVHSAVGVSGSMAAVRAELYRPIPPGTILDDMYWPLRVVMQGYRVVHQPGACAWDRLPDRPGDEFARKVRTLSGNYQLLARLPSALWPGHNPLWGQLLSHKLLRLLVPWALLGLLIASAALDGVFYRVALVGQLAFYLLGISSWRLRVASEASSLATNNSQLATALARLASVAGAFLLLNAAAAAGLWVFATGRCGQSWKKVSYDNSPHPRPRADRGAAVL